jgi:hypothetical protein
VQIFRTLDSDGARVSRGSDACWHLNWAQRYITFGELGLYLESLVAVLPDEGKNAED